jgi:hypothetical protein
MSGPEVERIVLELHPGEPINGVIHRPGEPSRPFRGWLELAGQLERPQARAHDTPDRDPTALPGKYT